MEGTLHLRLLVRFAELEMYFGFVGSREGIKYVFGFLPFFLR